MHLLLDTSHYVFMTLWYYTQKSVNYKNRKKVDKNFFTSKTVRLWLN